MAVLALNFCIASRALAISSVWVHWLYSEGQSFHCQFSSLARSRGSSLSPNLPLSILLACSLARLISLAESTFINSPRLLARAAHLSRRIYLYQFSSLARSRGSSLSPNLPLSILLACSLARLISLAESTFVKIDERARGVPDPLT
jgi:hypothetical protein